MVSVKVFVIACAMMLMVGQANAAVGDVGEACKADGTCTTPADQVCDPVDYKCKVKADGTKTGCGADAAADDAKCPANAACSSDTCSCSTGYSAMTSGLCSVIGKECTADSDCSSKITNSYCPIRSPCSKGLCTCTTGYSGDVCTTLTYDKACDGTKDLCGTDLECTNSKCACSSGNSWNSDASICTAKKVFGETCSAIADCNILAAANGACTGGACTCATDYIEDRTTWTCRKPYAGESTCTSGNCDKTPMVSVTSDTSQQTPTCSSTTCGCGTGESQYESYRGTDTCKKYCITDAAAGATLKSNGATCTHHNECSGNLCLKCPGDANDVCYTATCGTDNAASMIQVNAVLMALLMTAVAFKQAF